jgi:hypothetical protein
MSRLRRLRARPDVPPSPAVPATTLAAVRDDSSFTADDGSTVHSVGYLLLDPTGEYTAVGDDDWLRPAGCRLTKVAGLTHHPEAAQDARFAAGSVVLLAAEPDNPADPDAVGVWDKSGELRVGYLPADLAPEIAARIAAGEMLGGAILREYRTASTGGRRLGLVLLIAPAGAVTLRVQPPAAQ